MKQKEHDPVVAARRGVEEAQAALAAHEGKKLKLDEQAARLTGELDGATLRGDEKASDAFAEKLAATERRIASLDRIRPQLVAAVTEAEATLKKAEQDQAQAQIEALAGRLEELNGGIVKALEQVLTLVADHARTTDAMNGLAHTHQLPRPPQRRLMLPVAQIRSSEALALRDCLDRSRVLGLQPVSAP